MIKLSPEVIAEDVVSELNSNPSKHNEVLSGKVSGKMTKRLVKGSNQGIDEFLFNPIATQMNPKLAVKISENSIFILSEITVGEEEIYPIDHPKSYELINERIKGLRLDYLGREALISVWSDAGVSFEHKICLRDNCESNVSNSSILSTLFERGKDQPENCKGFECHYFPNSELINVVKGMKTTGNFPYQSR